MSPTEPPAPESGPTGHPLLVYTGLRLVLFAIPFFLLLVLSVPVVWALLIAALLSSFVSIFVLARSRDQLSMAISTRRDRMRQRMAEREQSEDEWDDSRREDNSDKG